MLHNVAVPLVNTVSPFEFSVACEVFGLDRTDQGVPPFDFAVCSEQPGQPVPTEMGFTLTAQHGFDRLAEADLIVVPASRPRQAPVPEPLVEQLRAADKRGAWVMSLCSGAFTLAKAGLLDGRRATTHWMNTNELAEEFPAVDVVLDVLFVEDGNIITSAGTAAGIDATLHLVRRELGATVASAIARRMVVPPQRDGGQRQYVEAPLPAIEADSLQPVLEWATENLAEDLSVETLARRAMMSERTFARRFRAETGATPHAWVTAQRVLLARRLLEDTDASVEQVAGRTGLGTAAILRHHFTRQVGTTPQAYRRTFRCTG
ncbi:helix-turn-helix domain-containing protein [Knoellia sp. 3-2P3]|uniref:GlxA family transcriptional regulator n=1 Tax=unclassified Knoellia TaxID=2618719 RepID=UPI0023DA11EE|nr:helix-turn-helix domain-containing protein [Knoellia sp. 3-2P3]MDF2092812.1 helix-turn-helix domain-containing protein [Knoellia sp. 3-2P3]